MHRDLTLTTACSLSVPVGSGGTDGPDLGLRQIGRCSHWPSCLTESGGLLGGWPRETVGCRVVGTASPLLVAEGAELFAVLDNPAFEGVNPVGVGEAVAEFRWAVRGVVRPAGRTASGRSGRQWRRVGAIGGRRGFPRVRQPRASPAASVAEPGEGRVRAARVPAGMQLFEDGMGEAVSVPVVMPLGDDPCCAAKLLARPGGVVDGGGQPLESAVSGGGSRCCGRDPPGWGARPVVSTQRWWRRQIAGADRRWTLMLG